MFCFTIYSTIFFIFFFKVLSFPDDDVPPLTSTPTQHHHPACEPLLAGEMGVLTGEQQPEE
jgi:hypothetical protein